MDWLSRSSTSGSITHEGPPLTINTLLEAIVKAYEIQGCFLLRNAFNARGIDHVILVKLASTAVVSWLLGLSEEQAMAAISHVWMDGHPLRVYRSGVNTIPRKGWAAGDACMRAVHLALMVRAGQLGSPTALTMPRWGFYATMWGGKEFDFLKPMGSWTIENIFFKVMPVEGHGISATEAALVQGSRIRGKGLHAGKDIATVAIRTTAAANLIINKKGRLTNAADRDHCMQYMVALALLKGDVPEAHDFQNTSVWAKSPALDALKDKIEIREDEGLTRDYLNAEKKSIAAGVTVEMAKGEVLEEVLIEFPIGHVKSSKTAERVREKFVNSMVNMFTSGETSDIFHMVEKEGDCIVHRFVDAFIRDTHGEMKL